MTLAQILSDLSRKFETDATVSRAAALAYYTTLSIAPFSVISLLCLSLLGPAAVGAYTSEVANFLGPEAGRIFSVTVESVKNRPDVGSLTGLISLITLFLSAGAVFGELRQTLNRIHRMHAPEEPADASWAHAVACFVRERILSAGLVLGFIFVLITSLILSSAISFFSGLVPAGLGLLINWVAAGAVYVGTFSLLFHYVPSNRLRWRDAVRGGIITSVFFLFGKEMISRYLGSSDTATAYGAAGSLVVFLLWIYYSSIILFASAQLNVVLAKAKNREGGKMAKRTTTIPPGLKRRQERRLAVWENDGGQLPENAGEAYLVNGRMVTGWWGHLGWIAHRTLKKLRAFFHVSSENAPG